MPPKEESSSSAGRTWGRARNELLWRALDPADPPTLAELSLLAFGVRLQAGDRLQNRRTWRNHGVTCRVFNAPAPEGHYLRTMDANEQFEALGVQRVWIPAGGGRRRVDPARWGVAVQTAEGWVNVSKGEVQFAILIRSRSTLGASPRERSGSPS